MCVWVSQSDCRGGCGGRNDDDQDDDDDDGDGGLVPNKNVWQFSI